MQRTAREPWCRSWRYRTRIRMWMRRAVTKRMQPRRALLLAVAMVAVGLVHGHRQKKREKEFEEQLEEKLEKIEASPAEEGSEGICHT